MQSWLVVVAAVLVGSAAVIVLLVRRRRVLALGAGLAGVALAAGVSLAVPPMLGHHRSAAAMALQQPASSTPTPAPTVPTATWVARVLEHGRDYSRIPRLHIPAFPEALRDSTLRTADELPAHGVVGSVVIPATRSHFTTRPALVYLPPAARVPQPRLLPVVVAFSGQSRGAGPYDLVWSGNIRKLMDGIAAKHHGVAPIVVVPDQLGSDTGNPMCVDSTLGNVASYVMRDVRHWILGHLPVETSRQGWTVAGFSEGGTCAIQFAAAHPDVFGSFVDVSGELAPADGSVAHSIAAGFGGSRRAYEHASPSWILAHHRYDDEQAYFAAGALDRVYGPVMPVLARRARQAGMTTHEHRVPGFSHNWVMAVKALTWGFDHLVGRWGI